MHILTMAHPLIGLHAILGELAIFAFLWVFIELIKPEKSRIERAKIIALIGVILMFTSWFVSGYYYVNFYGPEVKPIIKEGPNPWAHSIFTETKEHVFLFLPFLSLLAFGMIMNFGDNLIRDRRMRYAVLLIAGFIVLIGLSMAGMGYIISQEGYRTALEAALA